MIPPLFRICWNSWSWKSHERNSERLSVRLFDCIFSSPGDFYKGEFYEGSLLCTGPPLRLPCPLWPRFASASALRSGATRRFWRIFPAWQAMVLLYARFWIVAGLCADRACCTSQHFRLYVLYFLFVFFPIAYFPRFSFRLYLFSLIFRALARCAQ